MLGLDLGSLLLMVAVEVIVFLAVDLLAAGGGMTAGMITGMAGMMSTPCCSRWWGSMG